MQHLWPSIIYKEHGSHMSFFLHNQGMRCGCWTCDALVHKDWCQTSWVLREREREKQQHIFHEKGSQQDDFVTGAFLWEKWKFSNSRLCRNWTCNNSKNEYRPCEGVLLSTYVCYFWTLWLWVCFREIIMHNSLCGGRVSQMMTVCIRWFLSPDITDEPQVSSGQVTHLQPAGKSHEAWHADVCCPGTQVSCLFWTTCLFLPWTNRTNSLCFVYVFTWATAGWACFSFILSSSVDQSSWSRSWEVTKLEGRLGTVLTQGHS